MTRLTLHTPDSAPADSRPLVETALRNNGFLPNLIAALANAPVALEAYLTLGAINARASLSLAEREVVQIAAARIHGCDFCIAGHSAIALKKAAFGAAEVVSLQRGQPVGNQKLDALAAFTSAVIATRGAVSAAAWEAFQTAGFGQQQALEVILGVSLATLCNFANGLAGSPINPELQPYAAGTLQA